MIGETNRRGYSTLAYEIVSRAVKDWKNGSKSTKAECESFFRSEWYQSLRILAKDRLPEDMMRQLA